MVLRVKPTPTRLPTNSLYTPMDNTLLHSISSVCHPWGSRRRAREERSEARVWYIQRVLNAKKRRLALEH